MVFRKDSLMKLILGFTSLLLLLSCESEKVNYSLLLADNMTVTMDNQQVPKTSFNGLNEQGTWSHKLDQVEYSKGTWDNGLKKGTWTYNTGGNQFDIIYTEYKDAVSSFQISYPTNWKIYEKIDPSSVFSASDTTETGNRRTKLFIVLAHDKEKIGHTLSSFNDYVNQEILTDSVLTGQHAKITGTSRQYFINIYAIKKYGEELLIFNLLGENGGVIYDITYKTKKDDFDKKLLQFLEMSFTARLNGVRLLDPLDKIEKLEKVEPKTTAPNRARPEPNGSG